MTTHIFTYGTLMSTANCDVGRAERAAMSRSAQLVGPASLRGSLYDVGLYPAAVPTPLTLARIHGEIWRLPSRHDDLLATLDRYEGCGPCSEPMPQYRRTRVHVRAAGGRRFAVWMYVWNRSTSGFAVIPSGRWRAPDDTSCRIDIIRRRPPDASHQPSPIASSTGGSAHEWEAAAPATAATRPARRA